MSPAIEPTTPIESSMPTSDDVPESLDQMSVVSDESVMEPFEDYKAKIEKLLEDLNFPQCSIESIQHGYEFQNCVYALTSLTDPSERYIVRVPAGAPYDLEENARCPEIDDSVCVMNFLRNRLPVAEIKNFSATPDNSLESPYAMQTRLEGQSLNHVYGALDCAEKRSMIDQYIDLIVKMESIRFTTAGSLVAPNSLPKNIESPSNIPAPSTQVFNGHSTNAIEDPSILADRTGFDIKRLFKSLITKYITSELQSIADGYNGFRLPHWRRMETMLDEMEQEGFFLAEPEPVVMHHWDLEARNIMVAKNPSGEWTVTGVIDWDEAICLPRPLARKPPAWFWTWSDSDEDTSSGESDCDQFPDRELSETEAELKAYFDHKVEEILPGYLEDAYASGRLLRRLWNYIQDGLSRQWTIEPCEQLLAEWETRPRNKNVSSHEELKPHEPVADDPVQPEPKPEQPQSEESKPERADGTLSKALKRWWRKALGWFSIRF
ncbi:MAG: hypothetical protein Q9195_007337 [Heterodermia aff. obscurata]